MVKFLRGGGSDQDLEIELGDYGIAVRAGVVTPQTEDEDYFRAKWGLPSMSKNAKRSWKKDKGARRPITLAANDGKASSPAAESGDEE